MRHTTLRLGAQEDCQWFSSVDQKKNVSRRGRKNNSRGSQRGDRGRRRKGEAERGGENAQQRTPQKHFGLLGTGHVCVRVFSCLRVCRGVCVYRRQFGGVVKVLTPPITTTTTTTQATAAAAAQTPTLATQRIFLLPCGFNCARTVGQTHCTDNWLNLLCSKEVTEGTFVHCSY